ncbi:MAG: NAD-dependent epimerase/dehydratase family protein [Bryobacteraceae bacterium]
MRLRGGPSGRLNGRRPAATNNKQSLKALRVKTGNHHPPRAENGYHHLGLTRPEISGNGSRSTSSGSRKILVLGGAGYIGSVLCPYLTGMGDTVTVLDNLLYEKSRPRPDGYSFIEGDIRDINDLWPAIYNADAVVNLAALSNDPASDLMPELTWQINYKANEMIADLCRSLNKRVVFASSCSVYGFASEGVFTEKSALNPVSLYAQTKRLAESFYSRPDVDSIILRFATVYGHSPKPRFDLVVNTMIGTSYFKRAITVNGGDQWRPLVHVKDVAKAIYLALHRPAKHRVYNIGSNEQNFTISALADIIQSEVGGIEVFHDASNRDTRSYHVDFSRVARDWSFNCEYSIRDAVREFSDALHQGEITGMADDVYFRVKYLMKHFFPAPEPKRVVSKLFMY